MKKFYFWQQYFNIDSKSLFSIAKLQFRSSSLGHHKQVISSKFYTFNLSLDKVFFFNEAVKTMANVITKYFSFNIPLKCTVRVKLIHSELFHVKSIIAAQKMKFFIKNFFSKCDQIRRKRRIWPYLLKKSLMENFIFYAVYLNIRSLTERYFCGIIINDLI